MIWSLFLATQRETTEERLSIRGEDQNEMVKVEPDDEESSAGAAYCLRARRELNFVFELHLWTSFGNQTSSEWNINRSFCPLS